MADDLDFVGAMQGGAQQGVQIGNAIIKAFSGLLLLLARPLVLCTQIFFRKDMGERYLDSMQAGFTGIVIAIATAITMATAGLHFNRYYAIYFRDTSGTAAFRVFACIIGVLWIAAVSGASYWHFYVTIRQRSKAGILWHSRSDGVPRVPVITFRFELAIIAGLAFLTFLMGLYGFMVLLVLSLVFTYVLDASAKKALHNRVLDATDAQLESEWFAKAIEERLTPAQAHGVNATLPAHISDEYRKKVAGLFKQSAAPQ